MFSRGRRLSQNVCGNCVCARAMNEWSDFPVRYSLALVLLWRLAMSLKVGPSKGKAACGSHAGNPQVRNHEAPAIAHLALHRRSDVVKRSKGLVVKRRGKRGGTQQLDNGSTSKNPNSASFGHSCQRQNPREHVVGDFARLHGPKRTSGGLVFPASAALPLRAVKVSLDSLCVESSEKPWPQWQFLEKKGARCGSFASSWHMQVYRNKLKPSRNNNSFDRSLLKSVKARPPTGAVTMFLWLLGTCFCGC